METCYTLITAHSGCNNTPPNSMKSLIVGMESGADFVEVDVRTDKNGLPVLFHDGFIKTTNQGSINIYDYTLSELNNFIKSDSIMKNQYSEIITFSTAVSMAKEYGCFLNVDIKDDNCIDPMAMIIKDADMVDSVIITGCKYSRASSLKKKYPEFQILLNVGRKVLEGSGKSASLIAEEVCRMAVDASCCGINIEFKYLTDELVHTAIRRFLPISIWTLKESDNLDDYLKIGLYSITTTAVDIIIEKRKKITNTMALPGNLPEKI